MKPSPTYALHEPLLQGPLVEPAQKEIQSSQSLYCPTCAALRYAVNLYHPLSRPARSGSDWRHTAQKANDDDAVRFREPGTWPGAGGWSALW